MLSVFGEADALTSFTTVTYGQLTMPSAMLVSSAAVVPVRRADSAATSPGGASWVAADVADRPRCRRSRAAPCAR